jgi:hypothetical protein
VKTHELIPPFGRALFCSLVLCGLNPVLNAEGIKTDEPMQVNAAVDLSPLAKKLNELAKLSVLSTGVVKDQVAALGADIKGSSEAVKKIEASLKENSEKQAKKIDQMVEMLTRIQQQLAPVAFDYYILRTSSENRLKELGAEGWMLVTSTDAGWLIFRKPLMTKPTITPE